MLDNTSNQPTIFRTKNWVEINDDPSGNTGSEIKFKTSVLRSILCDYMIFSDVYILVIGTITVTKIGTQAARNNRNKKVILKNCTPFTDYINETNNTEIDHAKIIYAVMPMYNLIEYSDYYSKTSGGLCQYCRN